MDLGLEGARAFVGGASRGLGAGIATALAAEGARVALAARPSEALDAMGTRLGGVVVPADLSAADGPLHAITRTVDELGGLDLLVVNTGGPPAGTFAAVTPAQWQAAIDGTLLSTLRMIDAAAPHLAKGRNPAVLVILSSSVREPLAGLVTSNVLRPGLVGLIKTLVTELAPVRLNGIAPGRISTDRVEQNDQLRAKAGNIPVEEVRRRAIATIPLGRYGEPSDVGRVAAFLLSPAASYVNGQIVAVDGGMVRSLP